jgi:hypothetical protein
VFAADTGAMGFECQCGMGFRDQRPAESSESTVGKMEGAGAEELASRKEGCFDKVSTRMRRRAGAHPCIGTEGRVRKNRSTCMLIVPQP